ncbi:MAG: radical SAM/Cys-rich domain protein [Candidatus Dadabacteria bacterium]|nr:MAG: radical SAM/Cys-rich domain protein [Candidatus Dadabacteria bacterium]
MTTNIKPFQIYCEEKDVCLTRKNLEILQVNVGRLCNQTCKHCHVEAGPNRPELMNEKTAMRVIELLEQAESVHTLDITGGAPEMCPQFRKLAVAGRRLGKEVIDRCNLTIFFEKGYQDLPQFLADNQITVVASLPCYTEKNVDSQRGEGVFFKSIEALRLLNKLGYGKDDMRLKLHLVFNPLGASLPPDQQSLERDYKKRLYDDFEITFHNLYCITNMPIKRFLFQLYRRGEYDKYMQLLVDSFNPQAAENVMCRSLISIGWEGSIFDCDFNQMLDMPCGGKKRTIWDINSLKELADEPIMFDTHCYGCSAGAGSSCSGTLS